MDCLFCGKYRTLNTTKINKHFCSIQCSFYYTKTRLKNDELMLLIPWGKSKKERYYCHKNNITSQPECKFCGKKINFNKNIYIYNKYCSNSCSKNGKYDMTKKQLQEKYIWTKTVSEALYCHKNNIKSQPKCKFCEKNFVKFHNSKTMYSNTCSQSCGLYYKGNISKNKLKEKYIWAKTVSEALYCHKNNIKSQPKCKFCEKNFVKFSIKNHSYFNTCSIHCGRGFNTYNGLTKKELKRKFYWCNNFKEILFCYNNKIEKNFYLCKFCNKPITRMKGSLFCSGKCSFYFNKTKGLVLLDLKKIYIWTQSFNELYFCYKNNIKSQPKCKFCEKNFVKFSIIHNKYNLCCGNTCNQKYIHSGGLTQNLLHKKYSFCKSEKEMIYCHINNIKKTIFCTCGKRKIFSFGIYRCKGCITSKGENEVLEYIQSIYKGKIIQGDRNILNGKELDIYLPDDNLAIEYNGIYYHSSNVSIDIDKIGYLKNKYRHLYKTDECEKQNIQLLHIFEDEWTDIEMNEKWKLHIKWKLGIINKNKIIDKSYFIDTEGYIDRRFDSIISYKKIDLQDITYKIVCNNRLLWNTGTFKIKYKRN